MYDRLKDTFDKIHAEEELKDHTRQYLAKKTHRFSKFLAYPARAAAAMACVLLVFLGVGGYFTYFTEISAISVDVNPSLELGLNRFDKVISVEGYNKDGRQLAKSIDIRYLDYMDALEQLLASDTMAPYLTGDQVVSITVIGSSEEKSEEMLANVSSCTASAGNVCCSAGNSQEAEHAHEAGLSFGKYRVFLELQALDPNITLEDVQGLSMHQLHKMIQQLSPDTHTHSTSQEVSDENCSNNSDDQMESNESSGHSREKSQKHQRKHNRQHNDEP